jgi:O-antigen ligase
MPGCLTRLGRVQTSVEAQPAVVARSERAAWLAPGPLLLAGAIPILFIHVDYQPGLSVGFGSTTASAYLSDFAVLAVVLGAIVSAFKLGIAPLRRGWPIWLSGGLFLAWIVAATAYGRSRTPGYDWHTHAVTAAKFVEYSLLAVALPLLIRERAQLLPTFFAFTIWSALATAVGVAQFFGAAIFFVGTTGHRQASFVGFHDLTALSGATLLLGGVTLLWPRLGLNRWLGWLAVFSGGIGVVVGGAMAGLFGVLTAGAALLIVLVLRGELHLRRAAASLAVLALVTVGTVAVRGSDLATFARFLGSDAGRTEQPSTKVQTYAHRTLLGYIGLRIFLDHPVLGVGWEGSSEPGMFVPYLPAAHRRFPTEPAKAFPSPTRRYGVQDLYVQTLADMGVIGLAFLLALFGAGLFLAGRAALALVTSSAALVGVAWICLLLWLWTAEGLVAGIPLDALTWIAFGLAAAAAAWRAARA